VLEHRVDLAFIKVELASTLWGPGTSIDEAHSSFSILKVSRRLVGWILEISPGRVISPPSATGAFGTACPIPVTVARKPIAAGVALAGGVASNLVPGALAIEELIQVFLVEGAALAGSIRHGDGVLWSLLAVLALR
jgi:hypothetical protein